MKSVNIKLNLMTDGAKFVQIVGAYPYDMDLRSGRHVVDAKSILGIFSLDWSKPVIATTCWPRSSPSSRKRQGVFRTISCGKGCNGASAAGADFLPTSASPQPLAEGVFS